MHDAIPTEDDETDDDQVKIVHVDAILAPSKEIDDEEVMRVRSPLSSNLGFVRGSWPLKIKLALNKFRSYL